MPQSVHGRAFLVDEELIKKIIGEHQWHRKPHDERSDKYCEKCRAIERIRDLGYVGEKM